MQITFSDGLLDTDKGTFDAELCATMIDNLMLFNRVKKSKVSVNSELGFRLIHRCIVSSYLS